MERNPSATAWIGLAAYMVQIQTGCTQEVALLSVEIAVKQCEMGSSATFPPETAFEAVTHAVQLAQTPDDVQKSLQMRQERGAGSGAVS